MREHSALDLRRRSRFAGDAESFHKATGSIGSALTSAVRVYNTLTRRKEDFRPLQPGRATIYSCGPTVYRYVHVGNLRTFLFADLLCRALEYCRYEVRQVMNITDVGHLTEDDFDRGEDKMLLSARLENKSPREVADYYTAAFHDDVKLLNIRPAAAYPRATDYIERMLEIIAKLVEHGHAYEVGGNVYYDIATFAPYGRLSRNSTENLLSGVRGDVDPRKRHPGDFTLWKAAGSHRLQSWDSPYGRGFPGWHIECSAMSTALLGSRFDIHTGGADNVFPHHEAEIAQSEGAFGHQVVGYWMHADHLLLAGSRMAKSAGNFFRITELIEQGFDPLAFRYLALQARYRTKLNFSPDALAGADRALGQLRDHVAEWASGTDGPRGDYSARFQAAVADDLDLPAAMALVAEVGRSELPPGAKAALFLDFDRVLGLDLGREVGGRALPDGAAELLRRREQARAEKDFATADAVRRQLSELGVVVTDTPEGQRWKVTATREETTAGRRSGGPR
jgi:cysteinyl-tRNA synthetase